MRRYPRTLTCSAAVTLAAGTSTLPAQNGAQSDVVRAGSSTVQVRCGTTRGSGVVVGKSVLVATNRHVVTCVFGTDTAFVRPPGAGEWLPATLRWSSDSLDLALLEVATPAGAPLPLAADGVVTPTESVWAIGFPSGTFRSAAPAFAAGTISGRATDPEGRALFQHDAALNPGNSGGPLVNRCGGLVGINVLKLRDLAGVGYAVPAAALVEPLQAIGAAPTVDSASCEVISSSPGTGNWNAAGLLAGASALTGVGVLAWRLRSARQLRRSSLAIEAVHGALAGQRFPLGSNDVVIGRDAAECTVLYPDGDTTISRRHCSLRLQPDGAHVTITDDGSSNGTFVRGTRLVAGVPLLLEPGDRFSLGTASELWRIVEAGR